MRFKVLLKFPDKHFKKSKRSKIKIIIIINFIDPV